MMPFERSRSGRRATLADVAALAKVDTSTASRILNGSATQSARPETWRRVQEAAEHLGYQPDTIARSLRLGRTNTLALFVPDLENFGFVDVTRGVQQAAHHLGMLVLLVEAKREMAVGPLRIEQAMERRVDGILVASMEADDPLVEMFARTRMPLVLLNRRSDSLPHPYVVVDDAKGTALAVDHLVDLGHRNIGHIAGDPSTDTGRRRLAGFRGALRRHGLRTAAKWVVPGGYVAGTGYAAALSLVDGCRRAGVPLPTAIHVANLASTLGVLMALREVGLRVPEDVSVVTMDEHPVAASVHPGITTVAMPLQAMGAEAVTMLADVGQGKRVRGTTVRGGERLIVRGTTAPPT